MGKMGSSDVRSDSLTDDHLQSHVLPVSPAQDVCQQWPETALDVILCERVRYADRQSLSVATHSPQAVEPHSQGGDVYLLAGDFENLLPDLLGGRVTCQPRKLGSVDAALLPSGHKARLRARNLLACPSGDNELRHLRKLLGVTLVHDLSHPGALVDHALSHTQHVEHVKGLLGTVALYKSPGAIRIHPLGLQRLHSLPPEGGRLIRFLEPVACEVAVDLIANGIPVEGHALEKLLSFKGPVRRVQDLEILDEAL